MALSIKTFGLELFGYVHQCVLSGQLQPWVTQRGACINGAKPYYSFQTKTLTSDSKSQQALYFTPTGKMTNLLSGSEPWKMRLLPVHAQGLRPGNQYTYSHFSCSLSDCSMWRTQNLQTLSPTIRKLVFPPSLHKCVTRKTVLPGHYLAQTLEQVLRVQRLRPFYKSL